MSSPNRTPSVRDINAEVSAVLADMAIVESLPQSRFGYERAARAILTLDRPVTELVKGRQLRGVRHIGPSSERIVMEYVTTGKSLTALRAIAESPRGAEVEKARQLRQNFFSRAAVSSILSSSRMTGVRPQEYRGDFQMHSVWSDGAEPIGAIVPACQKLGHHCACITDHSYGLKIARGMSVEQIAEQHEEIDRLNARYEGSFRTFKGIEANILADGRLDMDEPDLRKMEIVVASPHSLLRVAADQTARMVAAVTCPGVNILGHPRGRRYGKRAGIQADWDEVFKTAVKTRVAIEIDGYPDRQDIDYVLARRAEAHGCLFALDSDAHGNDQLPYSAYAIAHARLAGIPAERVINCWENDRILEWAAGAWNR